MQRARDFVMLTRALVFVCGVILVQSGCYGFNMDTDKPIVHRGTNGSLFGYSVALHREGSTNILLIGAPRAQTSQPGVEKGGAVYRCPVSADECEEIIFDGSGHPTNDRGMQIGSKSHQFFGATLHSAGPDGFVVACAPRRSWSADVDFSLPDAPRYSNGACFVASNNFQEFQEFTPCTDIENVGSHRISACEAGFSATITEGHMLILGGPGSFYLQGQVITIDLTNSTDVAFSAERQPIYDNAYQGYSIAKGRFGATGSYTYAVGEPRANNFLGQVSTLNQDLTAGDVIILGSQMSAYFGHALVATDINNDGYDDLIVGAPMYVDSDNLIERWEVGRVYVYLQDATGEMQQTDVLTGTHPGGQFGFAVAALGDINYDGFNDIAVGAPFAGDDRSGIVYIFQGGKKRIKQAVSQMLRPSDFGLDLTSFGSSLTGGLDMDDNGYNDMLVGAYMSSASVLVRSRPIARIHKSVGFEPAQINLDVKDYQLPSGRMASSFNVTTCFSVRGVGIPAHIDVQYTLELDALLTTTARAAFVLENDLQSSELTQTIQLITDDPSRCQKHLVYVKVLIQEKNLPIGVRMTYDLALEDQSGDSSANFELQPILKKLPLPIVVESLLIKNTCKNYLCVPDLLLTAHTSTEQVAVGDDWDLRVDVSVTNYGEDAYESSFQASLPEGTAFVRLERISTDLSVTCSADEDSGVVRCDIGNPLPEEHTVNFGLTIRNDELTGANERFTINMNVDSLNYEPKNISADNYANVTIGVIAEAELSLFGVSSPEQVLFFFPNASQIESLQKPETEQDIGQEVLHLYMLRNLGPSDVEATTIEIYWPLVDAEGDYIFYLVSAELGTGEACTVEGGVNPDDIELDTVNPNGTGPSALRIPGSDSNMRKRRQSGSDTPEANPQKGQSAKTIECKETSAHCVTITCNVTKPSSISEDVDSAIVRIKSRMYEKTFIEKGYSNVLITSMGKATVLNMPYMQSILPDMFATAVSEVSTQVIGQNNALDPRPAFIGIPLWAYIVATIGGGFLLAVIVFGMWKFGFFKRKKIVPGDPQAETQDNWQKDVLIDEKIKS